jgi:hypothetical protein
MNEFIWAVVVLAAIVLVVAFIARAIVGHRAAPAFRPRSLPVGYFDAYQTRITEIRAMFVEQPRDAVAAARHMVEDLMVRLGYPTRLTEDERRADLASVERRHGEWYRTGTTLRTDATTEELRRSLQAYCDLARNLIDRAHPDHIAERGTKPEIAG